jgi:hypothetical protein
VICTQCDTERPVNKDGRIRRHGCPDLPDAPTSVLIPLGWARPPISQNQLRRTHYMIEAKLKAAALSEARWAIRAAKPDRVTFVDTIRLHYRPSTRRIADADGLAPTGKVCTDALVHEGVIPADDWRHVSESAYRIHPPQPGLPGVMWLEIVPAVEIEEKAS